MSDTKLPEGFTPWHGGECPVAPESVVEVIWGVPKKISLAYAKECFWKHVNEWKIIGYRVVEEQRASGACAKADDDVRDTTQVAPARATAAQSEAHQSAAPQAIGGAGVGGTSIHESADAAR